jgi:hypothetical protein
LNKIKAGIPGLSQELPRKAGEAAPTEFDRMLHAGEASPTQVQAVKDQKAVQDQSAYNKANDIPDPNGNYDTKKGESFEGAVNTKIDNNEYDKAIPALQQKLDSYKGDKNVDPGTTKKLQNEINQLKVTQRYGVNGQAIRKQYLDTTLSEWRDMGNPDSDNYDPETYQKLYDYASRVAKAGVGGAGNDSDKNKYYAAKAKTGRSAASKEASRIKSNTIGSLPDIKSVTFGNLAPRKITDVKIPEIQQIQSKDLIKKRTISVGKA